MFPHATCLCIKNASKLKQRDCKSNKQQAPSSTTDENGHTSSQNSHYHHQQNHTINHQWMIRRRIDFVEISVLNSSDVLPIGQKSLPRPLCNRKVSQYCIIRVYLRAHANQNNNQNQKMRGSYCTYNKIDICRSFVISCNVDANV